MEVRCLIDTLHTCTLFLFELQVSQRFYSVEKKVTSLAVMFQEFRSFLFEHSSGDPVTRHARQQSIY